jgi:molybdate transport system substrate-binding protein
MKFIVPVLVFLCTCCSVRAEDVPLFAAASNMMQVMTEILDQYQHEHGAGEINMVFGSSGNFARQIIQGAPFELFLSANKKYVDVLIQDNKHVSAFQEFAQGRIGYFIPAGSLLSGKKNLKEINQSLINGEYRRIAIANPDFAPYGAAARQSLQTAGLWAIKKEKLLSGENIAQAMQYTLAGGVDIGIVPQSFAVLAEIREQGDFFLIPQDWHEPIIEYLVLLRHATPESRAFYQYLLSGKAKPILEKYGYRAGTTPDNLNLSQKITK